MGNPGNETDRRNLHINRRDSRSTHARGSLLKSSAKAEKIKRIFEFCQHRQERAQSLSPSKLEALDCLLFKIIVTSLLFLFVWGSHCIACQATGAARHRVVFLFSPPGLFSSPFSAQIISIAIYSHPPTLLQLHLLLNPCSMDLLFQVLYFSVLELPFFKNTIFVSLLRFHIWFTLYDLFFKSQYVGIFIIVSLKKKKRETLSAPISGSHQVYFNSLIFFLSIGQIFLLPSHICQILIGHKTFQTMCCRDSGLCYLLC